MWSNFIIGQSDHFFHHSAIFGSWRKLAMISNFYIFQIYPTFHLGPNPLPPPWRCDAVETARYPYQDTNQRHPHQSQDQIRADFYYRSYMRSQTRFRNWSVGPMIVKCNDDDFEEMHQEWASRRFPQNWKYFPTKTATNKEQVGFMEMEIKRIFKPQ